MYTPQIIVGFHKIMDLKGSTHYGWSTLKVFSMFTSVTITNLKKKQWVKCPGSTLDARYVLFPN
jgi:hypothetical protein